jgi:hypothetical protein
MSVGKDSGFKNCSGLRNLKSTKIIKRDTMPNNISTSRAFLAGSALAIICVTVIPMPCGINKKGINIKGNPR